MVSVIRKVAKVLSPGHVVQIFTQILTKMLQVKQKQQFVISLTQLVFLNCRLPENFN